ncbi:glycosyltransferase family 4 protein [Gallaecimonas xiamenensis]|uniref:Fis family transcriptional regulator n=1 Tax=Gallaecimonas xiamenensis 3-C-1 TaxID=745411 RepID=K2JQ85_9GAMM|nr:glycosyltransferase family 4 protein [Gallaecimonas xiamenensis]EKE77468.1 Fis family transcriptional regulator [Gallaecimonas xiamenensis 3-C-1]
MHICHINLAKGFSGGERQTLNLIKSLQAQGVSQTLVTQPDYPLAREVRALGIPVKAVRHFLKGHLKGGDWDLLHCHDGKAVYWAYLEGLLRQTPYVITRRVDNPLSDSALTRSAYQKAKKVVCLSRAIASAVKGAVPQADTAIIPSSFSGFAADPVVVADIKARYPGKTLVGQVGKLLHHKGYQVTIAAARAMADSHPERQFLLLGEGPDRRDFEAQAQGLANVQFLGHRDDIGNWLAALDLMLFPSLSEGLGSTILEAMQHGVPVIGSDAGGIPDIIEDGQNGLLVPPGNAEALAKAIDTLLMAPPLQDKLRLQAQESLSRFSPLRVCQDYLTLYGALLS